MNIILSARNHLLLLFLHNLIPLSFFHSFSQIFGKKLHNFNILQLNKHILFKISYEFHIPQSVIKFLPVEKSVITLIPLLKPS